MKQKSKQLEIEFEEQPPDHADTNKECPDLTQIKIYKNGQAWHDKYCQKCNIQQTQNSSNEKK